jgi:DNA-binding CsgD family transcriptional regulator
VTARISSIAPGDPLSERDRIVLSLVAKGLTNRGIAERLHLSEDSVKGQMSAILRKLDAPNRTAAALTARAQGLLVDDADLPDPTVRAHVPAARSGQVSAGALRATVGRWQGRAPVALLAELGRLCGDQPVRRSA